MCSVGIFEQLKQAKFPWIILLPVILLKDSNCCRHAHDRFISIWWYILYRLKSNSPCSMQPTAFMAYFWYRLLITKIIENHFYVHTTWRTPVTTLKPHGKCCLICTTKSLFNFIPEFHRPVEHRGRSSLTGPYPNNCLNQLSTIDSGFCRFRKSAYLQQL